MSDNTDERRIKLKNEYLYTRFKNPDQLDFGVKQRNHFEESGKLEKDLSCLQEITESEITQQVSTIEKEAQESINYKEFMKSRKTEDL